MVLSVGTNAESDTDFITQEHELVAWVYIMVRLLIRRLIRRPTVKYPRV